MSVALPIGYGSSYYYCKEKGRSRQCRMLTPCQRLRGLGFTKAKAAVACITSPETDTDNNALEKNREYGNGDCRPTTLMSSGKGEGKSIDVVTVGNLCVDIVLNVEELPPSSLQDKYPYMLRLVASNPHEKYWEAGGNCNFAIAAARLGLNCVSLGQVGNEKYGWFLQEVLEKEGVSIVGIDENVEHLSRDDEETVLCWVLVDPGRRHSFCSRFDFNKEPAFKWINRLSTKAEGVIKQSKVLFFNGFLFDELHPSFIVSILECARDAGTAIFFDPGPRNKSLIHGTAEQQQILRRMLNMSDVLLLTAEEAESLTGLSNPVLAARNLLHSGLITKWVIIKLGSQGSLMVTSKGYHYAPAFKVDVADTVGCGDSYAAAIVFGYINSMSLINTLALANAVGGATAMGCGAGRNVATIEKVSKLLSAAELQTNYDDYLRKLLPDEYLSNSEIMLEEKVINDPANSFSTVNLHIAAKDALKLLQKVLQRGQLKM